jgi:hypothetical protein
MSSRVSLPPYFCARVEPTAMNPPSAVGATASNLLLFSGANVTFQATSGEVSLAETTPIGSTTAMRSATRIVPGFQKSRTLSVMESITGAVLHAKSVVVRPPAIH